MNEEVIYGEIGRRIKRFRKVAGQTQAQLASRIGMSRASIANIEGGRQNFLLHYLYAIAAALDLGTPLSLLPGAHEVVTPSTGVIRVAVPRKGLTGKQRDEVIRLIGSGEHGGSTAGGRWKGGKEKKSANV